MASRKLLRQLWLPVSKIRTAELVAAPIRRTIQTSAKHAHPFPGKEHIRQPPKRRGQIFALTGGGVLTALLGAHLTNPSQQNGAAEKIPPPPPPRISEQQEPQPKPQLKEGVQYFRLDEVRSHDGASERPWVTMGISVYDITDWIPAHPGGDVILRACGGSLDPYWDIFTIHKRADVYDILETYKIGEISPLDLVDGKLPAETIADPFIADPERDPRLITLTERPRNAETPAEGLAPFITPTELFYVRNHMWVPPAAEVEEHSITVTLPSGDEKSYTLEDLKTRFRTHTITATLQCSGNRRADMTRAVPDKGTNGLQWEAGAISCAEWTGVKLRDVLADAGLDVVSPGPDAKHAQFEGAEAYGASIPLNKALDERGDVLLAFGMNGGELPRDHGFPLRVIVPGNVAARSVKWLKKINISDEESTTQWQRRDYKCFGPNVAKPDWSKAPSIQEMPVTSAITRIQYPHGKGPVHVEGYAYSGGGREIVRVDVSLDEGKTWEQATLMGDEGKGSKSWWWKRWRFEVPEGGTSGEVMVKATDESYNTQPEDYRGIWNQRGNLSCAWHGVHVGSEEPNDGAREVVVVEKGETKAKK